MEIERKFLPLMDQLPFCPEDYPCRQIEQGYLCTEPVVRIRPLRKGLTAQKCSKHRKSRTVILQRGAEWERLFRLRLN